METGVGLQNLFLLFVDKHHEKCNKTKALNIRGSISHESVLMTKFSEDCSDYKAEDNAVENKGVVECLRSWVRRKRCRFSVPFLKFPIHIVVAAPLLRILRSFDLMPQAKEVSEFARGFKE